MDAFTDIWPMVYIQSRKEVKQTEEPSLPMVNSHFWVKKDTRCQMSRPKIRALFMCALRPGF